ncbi:MAG: hypothetical protein AB7I59_19305 [Geminicoccaceae bacterium]
MTLLNENLQRQLREAIGPDRFGAMGELTDWRLGLAGEVDAQSLTGRVRTLCPRLSRPESAMALALNSFLPWRGHIEGLRLCGSEGFSELHFDGRCPTGVRGTPPHVDVIAAGSAGVVGACVRAFDYLGSRRAANSDAYRSLAVEAGMTAWTAVLQEAAGFRYLDVAGLAKVAIGLGRIFTRRPVGLLYLFLEPERATAPAFAAHRAELDRVVALTAGSPVTLTGRSLHELWDEWRDGDAPATIRTTAAELCRRYGVAMPAAARM